MKGFILSLVALLVAPVLAQIPTVTDPDAPPPSSNLLALVQRYTLPKSTSEWKHFTDVRSAAVYAAARLETCSHYYECSAVIVKDGKGRFAVGPTRTDYISDSVRIVFSDVPSDWTVAANIHSHPCLPNHAVGLFSPEDIMMAIAHRIPAYMVDLCAGDVHEFIPGVNKPDTVEYDDGVWLTAGTIVGHVAAFKTEPLANVGL